MAIDITSVTFDSGRLGIVFDSTEINGTELIVTKDDTNPKLYLEYAQLACGSGNMTIFDGSDGSRVLGTLHCMCQATVSQEWDFRHDPIPLLADQTGSLCISAPDDVVVQGFVKYYWGP